MMQEEFERMVGAGVSEKEYRIIDTVYMYHPADMNKEDIAGLFRMGGIALINDLLPAAEAMQALEVELAQKHKQVKALDAKITAIKNSYKKV